MDGDILGRESAEELAPSSNFEPAGAQRDSSNVNIFRAREAKAQLPFLATGGAADRRRLR